MRDPYHSVRVPETRLIVPNNSPCRSRGGKLKVRHSDKQAALVAADRMQSKHGQAFRTYKCRRCKHWHNGSQK